MQGAQLEPALGPLAAAGQYEEDEEETGKWWDEGAGALGPEDVQLELGGDEDGAASAEPSPGPPRARDAADERSGPEPPSNVSDEPGATQGPATRPTRRVRSVAQWSVQDVCQWLTKLFPRTHKVYAERFKMHDITGAVLLHLTERKLERIGLVEEQRQQLMYHVLRLRLKEDMRNLQQSLRRTFLRPGTPTSSS